jgi:hypothetical protein
MQGRFVRLSNQNYEARPVDCSVAIVQDGSAGNFVSIARLDVHIEQSFYNEPEMEDAIAELKTQACLSGADAIVDIHKTFSSVGELRILHVTATGVKYKR